MSWINVTQSLPETGKKVIATFVNQSGKRRTICAHYIERWALESDSDDDCYDEYSEEKDAYFYCKGWYENIENWGGYTSVHVCEGEVTHWMPLPESPEQQAPQPVDSIEGVVTGRDWRNRTLEVTFHTKVTLPNVGETVALLSAGKGGEL
jgi:hypothetical protein